jgi:hypothetical protein
MLRSKAGEANALANLAASDKQRLFPLIHVSEAPAAAFVPNAGAAWNGRPMALDGMFNFGFTGSTAHFTQLFTGLGRAGVLVIPSIECDAPAPYVTSLARYIGRFASGLVVKASLRQLPRVSAWVIAQGWQTSNVDLVIMAGHAADYDPPQFADFLARAIATHIPNPHGWRTVTLASSAAPKDASALAYGRNDVPRLDWQAWQAAHTNVGFQLDYGDYGIAHPDLTEPPGVAMARATVSVRYTIDDFWIILKGRPTGGPKGQPMQQQYRRHAATLAADPQFGGLTNCWGDQRIQQIAAGGAGWSRPVWVAISVNRHLSFVADRLP